MKKINLLLMSLVALFMACFTACESKYDVDHTAHIVGTWTYIGPNYAEAFVIKEDGSVLSTGVEDGEYWENVAGTIKIKGNVVTMTFEDGDDAKGHIDVVPGIAFSIYEEDGEEWTFNYCAEDLSEEVVGMWVCHEGLPGVENDMAIKTYSENGKYTLTTQASAFIPEDIVGAEADYVIIGDLLFVHIAPQHLVARLTYTPNGTTLGDIMTETLYAPSDNGDVYLTSSWLRINQSLDLAGQNYNYIKTYVTNVKGEDKDIDFMGYTFNFAKMDGSGLDKMLKALLFAVEFPDANTLGYSYQMNGNKETYNSPIVVEGNKMTIKMSAKVPTLKDVVLYAFQDADCSQMHFYMHKTAFVNFYTNMQAMLIEATDEQFDITNAEAVNAIYNEINNAVETINVSFVMSKAK